MRFQARTTVLAGMIAGAIVLSPSLPAHAASSAAPVDAGAARRLAQKDHCLRCHAVASKKEGPSYREIAAKFKGQPGALTRLVAHLTSGKDVVTLSDGHQELHKFDKATDRAQIDNLVRWILAQ